MASRCTHAGCCIYKLSMSAFQHVSVKQKYMKNGMVCRIRYELSIASDTEVENGEGQVSAITPV